MLDHQTGVQASMPLVGKSGLVAHRLLPLAKAAPPNIVASVIPVSVAVCVAPFTAPIASKPLTHCVHLRPCVGRSTLISAVVLLLGSWVFAVAVLELYPRGEFNHQVRRSAGAAQLGRMDAWTHGAWTHGAWTHGRMAHGRMGAWAHGAWRMAHERMSMFTPIFCILYIAIFPPCMGGTHRTIRTKRFPPRAWCEMYNLLIFFA